MTMKKGYASKVRRLAVCAAMLALGSGCAVSQLWEPTREQVLERILPSSVQIVMEQDGDRIRTGSGVAVAVRPSAAGAGADCYILTSGHTVTRRSGREHVYVLFGRHRGAGTKAAATVLAQRETEDLDLALLRAQTSECFPAALGRPPGLGEPIWVVAYPWGRNMTLAGGVVSQVNSEQPGDGEMASRLMVDASVSYGASGGGVYDGRNGRLVGLVEGYRTARVSFQGETPSRYIDVPVPGETYVVPLADIRRFLTEADQADLLGERRVSAKAGD